MVFFFLIPSIPATLGNFLVPLMIGAKDLAFPKINLLSWYLYIIGGSDDAARMLTGGVDTGWTFYTPYSSVYQYANRRGRTRHLRCRLLLHPYRTEFRRHHPPHARPGHDLVPLAALHLGALRHQHYPVLGTPVIAITIVLVAAERALHLGIFDPKLGGDPLLFQHLFWFYSPSRGLHHDLAVDGRSQRDHRLLLAQAYLRIQLRRLLIDCDRGLRFSRLGPPHVRGWDVGLRRR